MLEFHWSVKYFNKHYKENHMNQKAEGVMHECGDEIWMHLIETILTKSFFGFFFMCRHLYACLIWYVRDVCTKRENKKKKVIGFNVQTNIGDEKVSGHSFECPSLKWFI